MFDFRFAKSREWVVLGVAEANSPDRCPARYTVEKSFACGRLRTRCTRSLNLEVGIHISCLIYFVSFSILMYLNTSEYGWLLFF
jgi:hypothetical protein